MTKPQTPQLVELKPKHIIRGTDGLAYIDAELMNPSCRHGAVLEVFATWCGYCQQANTNIDSAIEKGLFTKDDGCLFRLDGGKQNGVKEDELSSPLKEKVKGFPTFFYVSPRGKIDLHTPVNIDTTSDVNMAASLKKHMKKCIQLHDKSHSGGGFGQCGGRKRNKPRTKRPGTKRGRGKSRGKSRAKRSARSA